MISDWIRGLRDPELLYKKLLLLTDQVEDFAKAKYRAACSWINFFRKFVWQCLLVAVGVTVFACLGWVTLRALGVEAAIAYHVLVLIVGLVWTFFLTLVALLLSAIEGIIRDFPRLERLLSDVKESVVSWLKLPAWVAFVALFLSVLVGRFPALRNPESFLSLLGIVAAFGLASFLGVCRINLAWLQRFVFLQLFLALIVLLIAPQFPHLTAWLRRQTGSVNRTIGQQAGPKRLAIDVDSPPPFFDAVSGEPLFWYSRRPGGGFALWDAQGFDPDTKQELEPVRTSEKREEILNWLRAEARRNPKPVKMEPVSPPKRLQVRSSEDINFVNQFGSNVVWFFGSKETGYELYDAPGFHRTGVRLTPVDTDELRQTILNWFRVREQTAHLHQSEFPPAAAPSVVYPNEKTSRIAVPTPSAIATPKQDLTAVQREPWGDLSTAAGRIIAGDLLHQQQVDFGRFFTVQCTSAAQSRKRFNGYGVSSDIVVVTASFQLSAVETGGDERWSKGYDVSESVAADQFQGLTTTDTIDRIVGSLKEQILKDSESLSVLRKAFKP